MVSRLKVVFLVNGWQWFCACILSTCCYISSSSKQIYDTVGIQYRPLWLCITHHCNRPPWAPVTDAAVGIPKSCDACQKEAQFLCPRCSLRWLCTEHSGGECTICSTSFSAYVVAWQDQMHLDNSWHSWRKLVHIWHSMTWMHEQNCCFESMKINCLPEVTVLCTAIYYPHKIFVGALVHYWSYSLLLFISSPSTQACLHCQQTTCH